MSENKIKPALTAQEWEKGCVSGDYHSVELVRASTLFGTPASLVVENDGPGDDDGYLSPRVNVPAADIPALIALANAALPDSDPRKITREWIDELRLAVNTAWLKGGVAPIDQSEEANEARESERNLRQIADALESYLPPA